MSDETQSEPIHVRIARCFHDREARRAGMAPEPFVNARGRLCVPTGADPAFAWWERGGIAVSDALDAAGATDEVRERYADVLALGADPDRRTMGECSRAMDLLDCGGAHLEGWTAPEPERPADRSAKPAEAVVAKKRTRREQRAEAEVDLFAGVAG